jgi:cobalt-precorrin-5B (C1)-methyltransferase
MSPPARPLRPGWTTGTCATAAAAAACEALFTEAFPADVAVRLPRGGVARLSLSRAELRPGVAIAGVIKDAGDDPDVTHGCEVIAAVSHGAPGSGIRFCGGEGVGRVTLPGLPLPPGEPAINPGPRAMITAAIADVAARSAVAADVVVTLSIPGGEALAQKTLNGRLGIAGGLSILGTTGIVVPFSCAAWIHSIHRGIDVARAAGHDHLAAATGSVSERAVAKLYQLPERALIDMGDFIGGTLKYLRAHPVPRLTLAGGFGKLAKLAQGHLFVHSAKSRLDVPALAAELAAAGAPVAIVADAAARQTAAQVLDTAGGYGEALVARVAQQARAVAAGVLAGSGVAVEVIIVARSGRLLAQTGFI